MPKPSFTLNADVSQALGMVGTVNGTFNGMRTEMYASSVIELTHSEMADQFNTDADTIYLSPEGRKQLGHVYDWGLPIRHLWRHKIMGRGRNRTAGFEWLSSARPIPTPEERAKNPDDPMSLVPAENIKRLSGRSYTFYWKAPVIEYNLPVMIAPKWSKNLFIPTGNPSQPFVFANHAVQFEPGGPESTNAFTNLWTSWWATEAPQVFSRKIAGIISKDLAGIKFPTARYGNRSRVQYGSLAAMTDSRAAMEHGRAVAEEYIKGRANGYRRIARAIRNKELMDE